MFTFLLNEGANVEAVDSNGNNVFHLLVIHSLKDMFTFVKQVGFLVRAQQLSKLFPFTSVSLVLLLLQRNVKTRKKGSETPTKVNLRYGAAVT